MRPKLQRTKTGFKVQPVHPVTGNRITISGRTEAEVWARYEILLKARSELRNGVTTPGEASASSMRAVVGGPVTVKFLWDRHVSTLATTWKPKASAYWKCHLADELGERRAWELNQTEAERLLMRLRAHRTERGATIAPKTVSNIWATLSAAFSRGVRDRLIPGLPWADWRPKFERWKPRRALARSPEELSALALEGARRDVKGATAGHFSDLALRIIVCALCGLRQGEAAGLGWDACSIDVEPALVHVNVQAIDGWRTKFPEWERPQSLPKHGKIRVQLLHASAVAALRAQRERVRSAGWYRIDGPVFPSRGGRWRSEAEVIDPELFRSVVEACGFPNVGEWTPHSLRHSFASLELVANKGNLMAVKERTGHGSVRILEGYLHAMGHGLSSSAIPVLAPELMAAAGAPSALLLPAGTMRQGVKFTPEDAAEVARSAALAAMARTDKPLLDVVCVTVEDGARVDAERKTAARAVRLQTRKAWAKGAAQMVPLAKRWLLEGGAGRGRPKEITAGAQLAYIQAYSQGKRDAPGDAQGAKMAGASARSAYLARWARSLGMARAALARTAGRGESEAEGPEGGA